MTPRPHAWTRRAALVTGLVAGASLFSLTGCGEWVYFLQPWEDMIPADGPDLKGKKVVILTHLRPGAGSEFGDLSRDLTREVTSVLRKKITKITVVDPDKVNEWVEQHPSWTDPSEAAKSFEADMAIFLDIAEFDTEDPKSPGLMEGKSAIHIQVWEIAHPKNSKGQAIKNQPKESSNIYEEQADTTFPVRGPIPKETGISPSSFKIKFVKLVATEISWHFCAHAPGDDIQDVKFNPNDKN